MRLRWLPAALDRTTVLSLGILTGFAIGLSFNESGRRQTIGWLTGETAPAVRSRGPAAVPPPERVDPARPELAALLSPTVVGRVGRSGSVRVGVFGDSYGDGFWAALYLQLPQRDHYEVLRFSKEATGFTRYRTLNLEDRARRQLAARPIDIAVISFGANDVQPVFEGGHLHALMSLSWQAVIGARIDRFVQVARSTGAAVFWVGLPVMRSASLDDDVQAMNAFYAARMKALGVPFIETRRASLDRDGRYDRYLPDSETGTPRLMRANDGVHMTILGYQRLTTGLAKRLREDVALIRARAGIAEQPTPTPTPTPTALAAAPPAAQPAPRVDRPSSGHMRPPSRQVAPPPPTAGAGSVPTAPAEETAKLAASPPSAPSPAAAPAPAASATPDAEAGRTAKANRRERSRERRDDATNGGGRVPATGAP